MPKSWEVLSLDRPMGQLPTGDKQLVLFWLDHVIDMHITEAEVQRNIARRQDERNMVPLADRVTRAER